MRKIVVAIALILIDWFTFFIPIGSFILASMIIWKPKVLFEMIQEL